VIDYNLKMVPSIKHGYRMVERTKTKNVPVTKDVTTTETYIEDVEKQFTRQVPEKYTTFETRTRPAMRQVKRIRFVKKRQMQKVLEHVKSTEQKVVTEWIPRSSLATVKVPIANQESSPAGGNAFPGVGGANMDAGAGADGSCGCYKQQCDCVGQADCDCCYPKCGCAPKSMKEYETVQVLTESHEPQVITNMALAYATAAHYNPELMEAIGASAKRAMHRFDASSLSALVDAFRRLGAKDPELADMAVSRAIEQERSMKAREWRRVLLGAPEMGLGHADLGACVAEEMFAGGQIRKVSRMCIMAMAFLEGTLRDQGQGLPDPFAAALEAKVRKLKITNDQVARYFAEEARREAAVTEACAVRADSPHEPRRRRKAAEHCSGLTRAVGHERCEAPADSCTLTIRRFSSSLLLSPFSCDFLISGLPFAHEWRSKAAWRSEFDVCMFSNLHV